MCRPRRGHRKLTKLTGRWGRKAASAFCFSCYIKRLSARLNGVAARKLTRRVHHPFVGPGLRGGRDACPNCRVRRGCARIRPEAGLPGLQRFYGGKEPREVGRAPACRKVVRSRCSETSAEVLRPSRNSSVPCAGGSTEPTEQSFAGPAPNPRLCGKTVKRTCAEVSPFRVRRPPSTMRRMVARVGEGLLA